MRIRWTHAKVDRKVLCDWLSANLIDPDMVPEHAEISIRRGHLTVQVFLRTPDGDLIVDPARPNEAATGTLRVRLRVPYEGLNP